MFISEYAHCSSAYSIAILSWIWRYTCFKVGSEGGYILLWDFSRMFKDWFKVFQKSLRVLKSGGIESFNKKKSKLEMAPENAQ